MLKYVSDKYIHFKNVNFSFSLESESVLVDLKFKNLDY